MRVLVVVAHPDDETLGAGGTIARMVAEGHEAFVMAMTDGVGSRESGGTRAALERMGEWRAALDVLGAANSHMIYGYPDNRLDSVPMLTLARCVEGAVKDIDPWLVITHHSGDLNIDHRRVREAVEVACRPVGKRINILAMEVVSSTEWGTPFAPNYFVDIGGHTDTKRQALDCYQSELRLPPHPRSIYGVTNLACMRGLQCGCDFAEAFEVVRWFYD